MSSKGERRCMSGERRCRTGERLCWIGEWWGGGGTGEWRWEMGEWRWDTGEWRWWWMGEWSWTEGTQETETQYELEQIAIVLYEHKRNSIEQQCWMACTGHRSQLHPPSLMLFWLKRFKSPKLRGWNQNTWACHSRCLCTVDHPQHVFTEIVSYINISVDISSTSKRKCQWFMFVRLKSDILRTHHCCSLWYTCCSLSFSLRHRSDER